jgi:hypothetical protein
MKEGERLHRREPERTGPIRDFSQLYHRSNGAAGTDLSRAQPILKQVRIDDGAAAPEPQSVKAAYRIIQKHVDEGRQAAGRFSQSSSARRSVSDPLQQLLDRVIGLQSEMLPLLLDVMRDLVQVPPQAAHNSPSEQPPASAEGPRKAHSWIADVVCRRPVEIAFDVRAGSAGLSLATPGLHALDGNKPPLREISFIPPANDDGLMRLRIVIPENQMSGNYTGVIVSQIGGEVRGTISIKIED